MAEAVVIGGSPTSHEDKFHDRKLLISYRSKNCNSMQLTSLFASYTRRRVINSAIIYTDLRNFVYHVTLSAVPPAMLTATFLN